MKLLKSLIVLVCLSYAIVSCQKELNFDLKEPSSGTLKSNNGDCLPSAVKGTYRMDSVLNNSHYIEVTLDIGTPGTYTIKSDTVNGYSFIGSGTIEHLGVNTIKLQGSGTPLITGTDIFTIQYGNSSCQITVNVVSVAAADYFPLTQNSWWSYDFYPFGVFSDTVYIKSDNEIAINNNIYRIFQSSPDKNDPVDDSIFYRKNGTKYYQRIDPSDYVVNTFDAPMDTVALILNEAAAQGSGWVEEYDGLIGGQPSKIRLTFTMQTTNGNLDVNGHAFTNVHKIKMVAATNINNGGYFDEVEAEQFFAKGVGLIQTRFWLTAFPNVVTHQDIKNYQVL